MSNEPTAENKPAPGVHNPLADRALEPKEVPEVLDFLRENGTSVLIGVGLAVVIFLGFSAYRNYRSSQEITASSMVFNSRVAEQFQQVVDQYPKSSAASLAQLSLASQYFDEGQYELAQHVYGQFLTKYPGHALEPDAQLGNVQCLEALGLYDEALEGYERFMQRYPDHYRAPVAVFGKTRSLEQLGRFEEAKAACEDFLVAHPDDRWSSRARTSIQFIEKEMRARRQAGSGLAPAARAEQPAPIPVTLAPEAPAAPAGPETAPVAEPQPGTP